MINIIPEVQEMFLQEKERFFFKETSDVYVLMEQEDDRISDVLKKHFKESTIQQRQHPKSNEYMITMNTVESFIPDDQIKDQLTDQPEGYFLQIKGEEAVIYSPTIRGLFYGIQTFIQLVKNHDSLPALEIIDWPDVSLRCMNYDFRVMFPKFDKLIEYMEQFASFKANTILIEYEDKFPFQKFPHLIHEDYALSTEQFMQLKEAAYQNFIEIIPLQQTFGHLEYVLKHERYQYLKETDQSVGELCPSKEDSFELAKDLLDEIIDAHPESRYVHLGCDEVYSLCACEQCIKLHEGSREKTFIQYVNRLVDYVIQQGKIPIIWHDMMAKCSDEDIKLLDQRVIVMIWIYGGKNINTRVTGFTKLFRKYGIEVIGAPSVRCFDQTDDQNYPVADQRIANVDQWVDTAKELSIDGMVSTNWGTVFGLGIPYGIFETSWYLIGYSLDKYWNFEANSPHYMERFLKVFHGVNVEEIQFLLKDYYDLEDYYGLIGQMVEQVTRNKDVAELIGVMKEFEIPANKSRTIHKYIYRWMQYEATDAEKISLQIKHKNTTEALQRVRPKMEEKLRVFLTEGMVQHYIQSRFYIYDFLEEQLYQKSGLLK